MPRPATALAALLLLAAASPAPAGEEEEEVHVETGTASWYGPGFEGRPTASGEPMRQNRLTAAHPTLPLDTTAEVTTLEVPMSTAGSSTCRAPPPSGST
jgi:rare lipoprotein A